MQKELRGYKLLKVQTHTRNGEGLLALYRITKNPSSKKLLAYVMKEDRTKLHIIEPHYFNNADRIIYLLDFLNEYGIPFNKKSWSLKACQEYLFTEYNYIFPRSRFKTKKALPIQKQWDFD